MRILIVEDNAVSAKMMEASIEKEGYATVVAQTGKQAIDYLRSISDINLIITDIHMPEMDGLEFLGVVRYHPKWKGIPVIVTTGQADIDTVKKAAEMGCIDYLVKPIELGRLFQKIRKALNLATSMPLTRSQREAHAGFDPVLFQRVAKQFVPLMHEKIVRLEQRLQEATPVEVMPDLFELSEGASVLRADKVMDILNRLAAKGKEMEEETLSSEYRLLLKELKILEIVFADPSALGQKGKDQPVSPQSAGGQKVDAGENEGHDPSGTPGSDGSEDTAQKTNGGKSPS